VLGGGRGKTRPVRGGKPRGPGAGPYYFGQIVEVVIPESVGRGQQMPQQWILSVGKSGVESAIYRIGEMMAQHGPRCSRRKDGDGGP